jgi:HK97 family phage major capsid protein
MDMTEIKRALEESFGSFSDAQKKTADEIRAELATLSEKVKGQDVNLIDLGQKLAGLSESGRRETKAQTIGEAFVKSEQFKALTGSGNVARARLTLEGDAFKAVAPIFGDHDPNQFPVFPQRLWGVIGPGENDVWIRDVLPSGPVLSNMIDYVRETAFQNNADYQHPEGALKAQSDLSFEQKQTPVVTIAHWILASRQVLDDVGMLQAYINNRMTYGLRMKVDTELLNGDGSAGHMEGLLRVAAPFAPTNAAFNGVDNIRLMMAQIGSYFYRPNFIVMNPYDWAQTQLLKNDQGNYLFGTPLAPVAPRLWNMNVTESFNMPQGHVLVGDSRQAMVWDRQAVTVEVSREDRDNFVRNMVTILVEERLGLSVFADAAFAYGPLVAGANGGSGGGSDGGEGLSTRSSSKKAAAA